MTKAIRVDRKPLYIILSLSLLISIGYVSFRYMYPAQLAAPVTIDVISTLSYGPVELDGVIQKDAPLGVKGTYILVADSTNLMVIDQQGLDGLVGQKVHAKGIMSEPNDKSFGKNVFLPTSFEVIK